MPSEPQCESALTADEFEAILQRMVATGVLRACVPVVGAHAISFRVCGGFDATVNIDTYSGSFESHIHLGATGVNSCSKHRSFYAGELGDAYLLQVKTKPDAFRLILAVINRVRAVYARAA